MKLLPAKKAPLVALLVVCFTLSCNIGDKRKNTPKDVVLSMMHPLVKLLSCDQPKVDAALAIVGGQVVKTSRQNLLVEGDGFKAVLVYTPGDQMTISEIRLYPEMKIGVVFQDITTAFGQGRTIVESKTSTVMFEYKEAGTGNAAVIFANLLDPPKYPQSPVLTLTIQHGAIPWPDR